MPPQGELTSSAERGELEEVRKLIAAGADIEERDEVRSLSRSISLPHSLPFSCARARSPSRSLCLERKNERMRVWCFKVDSARACSGRVHS